MSPLQVLPLPIKPYKIAGFATSTALLLTILLLFAFKATSAILFLVTAMVATWYAGLKSTEKELQTERDIIAKVINIAACLIVVLDKEGRIVRFNEVCEKTTGYSFAEVKNKFVWDLFLVSEELEQVKNIFNQLKTEDLVSKYTNYWLTKTGERRLINWSNTVIVDGNGLVEYVIATGVDITDCRMAEMALALSYSELETRVKQRTAELTVAKEALQAQEERFRSLSSCSPMGIFMADIQGRTTYVNPRCQAIYDMTFEEILGDSWQNYIHPEDRELVLTQWHNYTREGGEYAMEYRLQISEEICPWINVSCSPMFSDSGELMGHVGTVRDVTERQQTQAALSSSEQQLRTLLENTPDIIIRTDKQLRYVYVNQAVANSQGQPVSFFIGKTSAEIGIDPEVCQLWETTVHKVFASGKEAIIEFQAPSAKGIRTYQSRVVPEFDKAGVIQYALIVARDITELKVAEVQKAQLTIEQGAREKAEIEQQRSRFLAEVSKMLAASFDGETVLQNIAELAVEMVAQGCWIHLRETDDQVRLVAVAHAEASWLDRRNLLTVGNIDHHVLHGYPLVIRTGTSELISELNPEILATLSGNEAELEVLRSLNIGSQACVPMTARGRVIGAITCFTSESDRHYNSADLAMLEDLAYHVALGLDNARLYAEAQQALAQTSESFALIDSLLEASPLGICFLDREMRYIRINQVLAELNGLSAEQHLGQDFRQLLPESAAQYAWIIQQVIDTGEPILNVEISGESKGEMGVFGHWVGNYYPVKNENGETIGAGLILTDITVAKQTEIALRESEIRFRSVVESNMIGIGFWDREGAITEANDALLNMLGYSREDLVLGNLYWSQITPPEQADLDRIALEQISAFGSCTPFEKFYIRKDGTRLPVLIGAAHFQGCQDKGSFFVLDISDRKQAEAARSAINQTLEALVQACPLAITVFNSEDGVVTLWNPAAERIFGWKESEALGHFLPNVPANKRDEFTAKLKGIREGNAIAGVETKRQRKDGTLIDIGLWATPIHDGKGNINCMSIVADISDRKQAEAERTELLRRERAARAEAEAINRLKDEFLATLSHELRTPLNAILGWAQVLRSRPYNAATLSRALEAIERQGRVQTHLVEDLLDVSRIIQGKLSLKTGWLDIVKTIDVAIDLVSFEAQAKSVTLNSQLDPALGLIWGDPQRLQQIISNLLSNAVKFTPSGGTVVLRLSRELGGWIPNLTEYGEVATNSPLPLTNYLQIQVSDTGKGISAEFLPYVFDRFRQADGSITRANNGLGLGLAIVRHLVELHGGSVTAESPGLDLGATFTVKLPLKQPKSQKSQLRGDRNSGFLPPGILAGLKVLVVDDEPDNRELLTVMLSECGSVAIAAGSAAEAIEILGKFQPDILVSDIGMPIEDGYSLIRKIRSSPSALTKRLPAIALTAYARDEDRAKAIAAGYDEHLTKPIEPAQFVAVLAKLAGLNQNDFQ
ncbi:PAS domain S-box protein [Microcoleus sp.]|uniref:PAS domain S-box protein n=1 Tax=Microcoleus sp. TaxID=44472 RepID=UPI003526B6D7